VTRSESNARGNPGYTANVLRGPRPFTIALLLAGCGSSASSPDGSADVAAGNNALLKTHQTTLDLTTSAGCPIPVRATVRIENIGVGASGPLAVSVTAPFALGGGNCQGQVLAAGASCDAEVTFMTSTVAPVNGTLTVAASPGGTIMVALTGTVFVREGPMFVPSALDFGPIPVGATSPARKLMLSNTGGTVSPPLETSVSGADFATASDTCNHAALQPGQSCAVEVSFRPSSLGIKTGLVLVAVSDACGRSEGTATLTGDGLPPPDGGAGDGP
jgi:hypothetical protein